MTTVNSLSAQVAPASDKGALGKITADFDMFLNLLTTQLQNQDPLDPMDSSEYTQQLVQYSQVEQSIQQTQLLEEISARLSMQDIGAAANLVGRQVEYRRSEAPLGDGPARWGWSADGEVAALIATVTNASGETVHRTAMQPGAASGSFSWDGTLSNGSKAPPGSYTLSLTGKSAAGDTIPVTASGSGEVTEVGFRDGNVSLLVGGVTVPLSQLTGVAAKG